MCPYSNVTLLRQPVLSGLCLVWMILHCLLHEGYYVWYELSKSLNSVCIHLALLEKERVTIYGSHQGFDCNRVSLMPLLWRLSMIWTQCVELHLAFEQVWVSENHMTLKYTRKWKLCVQGWGCTFVWLLFWLLQGSCLEIRRWSLVIYLFSEHWKGNNIGDIYCSSGHILILFIMIVLTLHPVCPKV